MDSHDRLVHCLVIFFFLDKGVVIFLKEKEKNLLDFFLHGMDTEDGQESSFQSKMKNKADQEWSKIN